ncbi:MAG: anthranilate synthase component I [Candidatus Omnitrophica bacterium]|nr:anthranilate synthase component I [Candidatus Omnitrophota bacterium]
MFYPNKKQFIELCKKGNVIPVVFEILADFDTPLSAFLKIDEGDVSYLLESVEGGERLGRYSILGSDPLMMIQSTGNDITITKNGKTETRKINIDPIEELKNIMKPFKFVEIDAMPRFTGGLIGYLGYDLVRFFEDIPCANEDNIKLPDMQFVLADTMIVFDHVDKKIKIISNAFIEGSPNDAYEASIKKIEKLASKLKRPLEVPVPNNCYKGEQKIRSNFTEKEFCDVVEKAKEHIKAGDIIQMVPSQRLSAETDADPFTIYRALRSINPSPYMFYLRFGDIKIIGSSPEILVRCENNKVEVRPIAGTRKRGKTEKEDNELSLDLINDPKERAEHIMLVDLGRNDIGRVCKFKSVVTPEVMRIEKYSHVLHLVSDVEGTLREDKDIYDVIRATFPAGTVTGAPKVKAMELIEKFEKAKRGIYAGSVGYISFAGNIDLCITIRTILMKDKTAYVQAGAGIVLDSVPKNEYVETLNKAKGMLKAIEYAEKGLL